MAKKSFGKRFVAILSTLALLLSMVAMVGSFAVSAEGYTPKRALSMINTTNYDGRIAFTGSVEALGEGTVVTVKGYYKVEGFTAKEGATAYGYINLGTDTFMADVKAIYADTDGWQEFVIENYVAGSSADQWIQFGFTNAIGTFSFADITMTDADGNVLYDMATDKTMTNGTAGHWWMSGDQFTLDPVYVPPYEAKRALSMINTTNYDGRIAFTGSVEALGEGTVVTVKGYYKVEGFTAKEGATAYGYINLGTDTFMADVKAIYADTDGWQEFVIENYVAGSSADQWIQFGFTNAIGTFSFADITMTAENGSVLYDMTTDETMTNGTAGHWWMSGDQFTLDPVVSAPVYAPKRVLSATGVNSEVNAKIAFYSGSLGLTTGKKATIKGYYKVEDFKQLNETGAIYIGTGTDARIAVKDNTDGWVEFELTFTVGSAIIYFEHYYTQGTISIADLIIEDEEGKTYNLVTDTSLPEHDHTGIYDDGKWYTGFYNKAEDAIFHFDKAIGNEPPPPPPINAVETPEIPNLLEQDATGYGPNRAFGIINTKDEMPVANFAVWAEDYFVTSDKYYVFAHVKVSGFEAFEGAADAACQIEMLAGENPAQIIGSWNANTEGWVALVDENGDPISFEKLTMADSFVLNFSVKNAKANFIIGDLIIADAAGNIVYSMANDKMLNLESDMRYTTSTAWNATPYVANPDGPTLFPIQTKGNESYVPNVSISIAPNPFHKTSETSIIIMTNAAPFVAGETYTIHGKMFVSIEGGFCGNANPKFDFTSHTLGPIGSASVLDTCGGWVSLVYPNGDPIVFKGTEGLDYVKFNLFNAYGALAVADIYITDSQGNVVYDMAKDEILLGQAGEFECEGFTDKGAIWRIVLNNYATGTIYVNEAPVEHTADDYTVPTFVEIVTVPGEDVVPPTSGLSVLFVAALSVLSASGAAVLTLKKKEN